MSCAASATASRLQVAEAAEQLREPFAVPHAVPNAMIDMVFKGVILDKVRRHLHWPGPLGLLRCVLRSRATRQSGALKNLFAWLTASTPLVRRVRQ